MMGTLGYHLKSLAAMPPRAAIRRVAAFARSVASRHAEEIRERLMPSSLPDLGSALAAGLAETLREFRERPDVLFPEARSVLNSAAASGTWSAVLEEAERVSTNRFDLLGSGEVYLGEEIDWHADFKTGYRWDPTALYSRIAVPVGVADIKVPWELSRFQHLSVLGQAYALDGDERYAAAFVRQVTSWIVQNPYKRGPNWACTMDVSIRAANWLAAWEFFRRSEAVTDDFLRLFLSSLCSHGRFIRSHLERAGGLTSNHYLADISGLYFIAALAPWFRESAGWRVFAQEELEREILVQVYPDGCDFEASTCYHRLALELFFFPALLGRRTGHRFSGGYDRVLRSMFTALAALTKPDGRLPQIGDNDSGRFLKFEHPGTGPLDVRYLLVLGALYFDEPRFLPAPDSGGMGDLPWSSAAWLFPAAERERLRQRTASAEEPAPAAFRDAGWYSIRHEDIFLAVSCGPNGQAGLGGHAHNDKLSFELHALGADLIVDPGTYAYTADPEARNAFRSVRSHNTLAVDDREQNEFHDGQLFLLPDLAGAVCREWNETGDELSFAGSHKGYTRLPGIGTHERRIVFRKAARVFEAEDILDGSAAADVVLRFHFAPGISVVRGADRSFIVSRDGERLARLVLGGEWPVVLEPYRYSPSYGSVEPAELLVVRLSGVRLPLRLHWRIEIA